jgi:hypothetical protein
MLKWMRGLVFGTAFLPLLAVIGHANTLSVTFNGVSSSNPTLTINDSALGTVTGYISPYKGTIGGQSVLLWCVDPDQDAPPVATTWSVSVATPSNLNSMGTTFQVLNNGLSDSQANLLYEEMARLVLMLSAPGNSTLADQEIQGAIWQLANNGLTFSGASGSFLSQVSAYETDAESIPLASGFEVLTDTKDKYQEYIVLTPEPSAFLMLGTGLVGLLYIVSRRKTPSRRTGEILSHFTWYRNHHSGQIWPAPRRQVDDAWYRQGRKGLHFSHAIVTD